MPSKTDKTAIIAITFATDENYPRAKELADDYQLTLIPLDQCREYSGMILIVCHAYLGLLQGPILSSSYKPFYIDFLAANLLYRSRHVSFKKEAVARAMGVKPKDNPLIIDATAGLGRDSFILASCGFRVTMLERSPILSLLMGDALKRASTQSTLSPIISKMTYMQTDALTWLSTHLTPKPTVIYLDPMFPERKKTAAVKKEMALLQQLVGNDPDADQLLDLSLSCANTRVVVKRPRLAPTLNDKKPSFSLTGTSSRFDIYLV